VGAAVDLDDPSTWPDKVRSWVEPWAKMLHGTTEFTSDLAVPIELQSEFRSLFAGKMLLGDHFTRLLDHEVELVRQDGLKPLTPQLVATRIEAASAHGALRPDAAAALLERNLLATGNGAGRMNKVCVVIGRRALKQSAAACDDQLACWGGEVIYRSATETKELVRGLGRPALAAVRIDVRVPGMLAFPSLSRLFVGALLGTAPGYGEAHVPGGMGGADIVGVYRPGDGEYDRHLGLPQN
jgi:hypothetical protein